MVNGIQGSVVNRYADGVYLNSKNSREEVLSIIWKSEILIGP